MWFGVIASFDNSRIFGYNKPARKTYSEAIMDLKDIREQINSVDYEIVKLLNERMELALKTRQFKNEVVDNNREKEVIANVERIPLRLVRKDFIKKLFEEIIVECREKQLHHPILVGFQGEHGANSEVATRAYNEDFIPIPCLQFTDVVEGVKKGGFNFGMLPVENSLEGGITEVNDLLIDQQLYISGEIKLPINYALLTLPDSDYRGIKEVYSHPHALEQCNGFINRNHLTSRPFYDTAGAARMIAEKKPRASAAIANTLCAELYNLMVIKENIEDDPSNFTRFALVSNEKSNIHGDKCSIIFTTHNQFGELYGILKIFTDAEINLTRIESRPSKIDRGNYVFWVDLKGSDKDEHVISALEKVQQAAAMYRFLGCYKTAD